LAFLSREVPRWAAKNKCYSCHNNGDAARALYIAVRLKIDVPAKSLADTTRWLSRPERWDHNGGEGPFSDKKLARLQFAAALTEAIAAGAVKERAILLRAAKLIADDQRKDGSWPIEAEENIGSPATYGPALATVMARRTLMSADRKGFARVIARADRWLRKAPVQNVFNAAAIMLGLERGEDAAAGRQRATCLALIRKGQGRDGGWGPYLNTSSEAFDTALVLLALGPFGNDKKIRDLVRHGRSYLVKTQQADGGWLETTRPAGSESYAQRLSTTGWATQALLATRKKNASSAKFMGDFGLGKVNNR
jgi:hypothetical protein